MRNRSKGGERECRNADREKQKIRLRDFNIEVAKGKQKQGHEKYRGEKMRNKSRGNEKEYRNMERET